MHSTAQCTHPLNTLLARGFNPSCPIMYYVEEGASSFTKIRKEKYNLKGCDRESPPPFLLFTVRFVKPSVYKCTGFW